MRLMAAATLAILLTAVNVLATAQAPDLIIYQGKEYALETNPMEAYFSKYPDKKPKTEVMSTGLWRGYIATFEFQDKSLVLKDIKIRSAANLGNADYESSWKSAIKQVVPKGETLKIDWFSGILVLSYGDIVNYVHMGYGSTYSNYILLSVKNGNLTSERKFDYKEYEKFKEKQFQAFKKTEEYKTHVLELKKENLPPELVDSFLRDFIVGYSSEFLDEEKPPEKTPVKKSLPTANPRR
jgi:hypothetical protein